MKTQFSRIFISFIFLIALLPAAFAQTTLSFPDDDEWFSIAVEQHGVPVSVINNKVELERAQGQV